MHLEFFISGYFCCRGTPILDNCSSEKNQIRIPNHLVSCMCKYCIFTTPEFGSNKNIKTSSVLIKSESDTVIVVWMAKLLLMYQLHFHGDSTSKEYLFLLYMEATLSIDNNDEILGCVCQRRATEDNVDHKMQTMVPTGHSGTVSIG